MAKKQKTPQDEHYTILGKMLSLMAKYGTWNIFKALILIATFSIVMYSITHIDDLVQKAFREQAEYNITQHDAVMKHRNEIKPKIDLLLQDVLNKTHADRVFVIEFHNGTNNLSGLPFIYCEMTYETCANGVEIIGDDYGSVSLSKYKLPYHMNDHKYFIGGIDEVEELDKTLFYRMKANNTTYMGVSNMPGIGYVGVEYTDNHEPAQEATLRNELYVLSHKVSVLLDVSDIKK